MKHIKIAFTEYIKENINHSLIDTILDKINRVGIINLSSDEKDFLHQYNNGEIDTKLSTWLSSDDEYSFDINGNKLLYNEFEQDEDILYNIEKLVRVISSALNKKPQSNNADWGGAIVWKVGNNDYIYLSDDELITMRREIVGDEYKDVVLNTMTNTDELYKELLRIKKA